LPDDIAIGLSASGPFTIDLSAFTKHGVVFGATGSGKTVLCKGIVEELSLRGIPILAIDPKGDIGALAIRSEAFEFRPFSDSEAEAKKVAPDEYARQLKEDYSTRLRMFGVTPNQVKRFVSEVQVNIYTPRSGSGIPISLSPKLESPKNFGEMLQNDPTLAFEILELTSSTLLKLVGYSGEERVQLSFISEILKTYWSTGKPVTLELLVDSVVKPPFEYLGRIPVTEILGKKERLDFNSRMNLLLTDPGMRSWFIGQEIDFDRWFKGNKTSINVIDLRGIASEIEKQAFVEYLLEKLFLWLIRQEGVQALRYLLYFDEIYGFCPPVSSPPSKKILLRLIKMSRAYGLGLLLATQNPSDVDYKVISNANLRCIGRLPTKQDIEHVRTGLDLSSDVYSSISSLASGKFLIQLFDRQETVLVEPRWLISYHRGPLDSEEIRKLTSEQNGIHQFNQVPLTNNRRSVVSVENVIPINYYPQDLISEPVKGAKSRIVRIYLSLLGLYVARFVIDYERNFTYYNRAASIHGEGTVVVASDGKLAELRSDSHNKSNYALVVNGITVSMSPSFPTMLSRMEKFAPKRETVASNPEEFEVGLSPAADEWQEFNRTGTSETISRLFQQQVRLTGPRTNRIETVMPPTRSVRFQDPKRIYWPLWETIYEVEVGAQKLQMIRLVDGTTGTALALLGCPRCPGGGGSSSTGHEIGLDAAVLRGCGHVTCAQHFLTCSKCKKSNCLNCASQAHCEGNHAFCRVHSTNCSLCSQISCSICYATKCGHVACREHRQACSNCGQYFCDSCLQRKGFLSLARVCPDCKRT